MDAHQATAKAFEQKVNTQLDEVKAKLAEMQAHAKGGVAQAELNTMSELKRTHDAIAKKRDELHNAGATKAESIKAHITTHLATLKDGVNSLHSKMTHTAKA